MTSQISNNLTPQQSVSKQTASPINSQNSPSNPEIKKNNRSPTMSWLKGIGDVTKRAFKTIWNTESTEKESRFKKALLFGPRLFASVVVGVVSTAASAVAGTVGAITEGIIGGTANLVISTSKLLTGAALFCGGPIIRILAAAFFSGSSNADIGEIIVKMMVKGGSLFLSGMEDFAKGVRNVTIGGVVAGSIALAAASGIGAPAIALLGPVASALSVVPIVGSALSHGATLVSSAVTIGASFVAANAAFQSELV